MRRVLGVAVVCAGAYAIYNQRHQVVAGAALLGQLDWAWLVAACGAELASMVAFAHIMRWLLRAGGVPLRLFPMVGITFAGNSMTVSLPGGVAWGASYAFDQLRRRGADRTLAVWVVLASGALDSFALFVLIVIGVWAAGANGPARDLRLPAAVLAAIPVLAAVVLFAVRHSESCHRAGSASLRWLGGHLRGGERVGRWLAATGSRLGTVQPGPWEWAASSAAAMANGVCDCACLVLSMLALGIAVPWRGLLVAYCLAQLSAALPITPGGLGVVEGSMSLALIAYGVHTDDAVAAVLLYRIISFWALVPIGWGAWGALAFQSRRAGLRGWRVK
ncbi:MAG: lysylphosphatidylglycerol synthase transmembrane domain-containing protein [Acidimicrobiales bacterium]